jgi:hypothetical protein
VCVCVCVCVCVSVCVRIGCYSYLKYRKSLPVTLPLARSGLWPRVKLMCLFPHCRRRLYPLDAPTLVACLSSPRRRIHHMSMPIGTSVLGHATVGRNRYKRANQSPPPLPPSQLLGTAEICTCADFTRFRQCSPFRLKQRTFTPSVRQWHAAVVNWPRRFFRSHVN